MQVLIAVDSRYGATLEIADAVVMGSGLYAGQWLRHARELLDRAAEALAGTPLWAFSSGPLSHDAELVPPALMDERLAPFAPHDHAVFPGRLDHRQLLMGDKAVAQSLDADDGDYRDWDAIEAWAARVAADLAG